MRGRFVGVLVLFCAVVAVYAGDQHHAAARQQALKLDGVRFPHFSSDYAHNSCSCGLFFDQRMGAMAAACPLVAQCMPPPG